MRELSPWALRSKKRDDYRAFYAAYMTSPEWFRRRERWLEEELQLLPAGQTIACLGCGEGWASRRDDLHHASYERLGDEAHEDLWPMCRPCHSWIHELMRSTRSWRKLPAAMANALALAALHRALDAEAGAPARGATVLQLRRFL